MLQRKLGRAFWDNPESAETTKQKYKRLYHEGPKPSEEQQRLIDDVQTALHEVKRRKKNADQKEEYPKHRFMVVGEGGSGKTFAYNVKLLLFYFSLIIPFQKIIANAKREEFNFLPMASTGIAAELLHEGQTVHKRLCRRKHVNSSTKPDIDRESVFAEMLRSVDGILTDEISMQHRDVIEYVDRLFRYVETNASLKNLPFAGKVSFKLFNTHNSKN